LPVRTDPDKLQQVLDNLLDNAVKYSPTGGRITVLAERRPGQAQVSISDQGIGIPKEQQGRLFEKFYRVDSPLKHTVAGTGLGLNLCKHIIEAHGGRIWVESGPGGGSTFSFSLPL
jgi:two-component system sensor histidine kinase VicK